MATLHASRILKTASLEFVLLVIVSAISYEKLLSAHE